MFGRPPVDPAFLRSLTRFAGVGGGVTAAVYAGFRVLLHAGLDPVAASALCWLFGLGLGFVLNKRVTFELRRDATVREVATFLAGYGLQLLIGMAGYALLMKRLRVDATVSFVLVTGVTAAFSFLFMRFVVFRHPPKVGAETGAETGA